MKKITVFLLFTMIFTNCNHTKEKTISFYKVPLVCGADREIACGSRVKPLFIETEKVKEIKESWINRQGTVIAIVWQENISQEEKEIIIQPLFKKCDIVSELISDEATEKELSEKFFANLAPTQKEDKWFKGMDVDQLSLEEARAIGDSATLFALNSNLITEPEALQIKKEIEEYMKTELVKVRTYKQLTSDETDLQWKKYGYEVYTKYIGAERAEKVRNYFIEYQKKIIKEKSCCKKEDMQLTSEITCPYCKHKKTETLPVDVCLLKYTCENCKKEIAAKDGDCCVFCSYASAKCPSKQ